MEQAVVLRTSTKSSPLAVAPGLYPSDAITIEIRVELVSQPSAVACSAVFQPEPLVITPEELVSQR